MRIVTPLLTTVAAISLACGGAEPVPEVDTSSYIEPIGLPAMPDGTHMGYILGFSPLTDDNRDAVAQNERRLIDAGLQVGRAQISWRDLEPSPGVYDDDALDEALAPLLDNDLAVVLLLETIDSSSFEIPEDLVDDELTLSDGRAFDDPVILERLTGLLTWLTPRLQATRQGDAPGVYALAVGNEPDNTITDQPDLGPSVAVFTEHARQVVRSLDPELAVSMTLTLGAIAPEGSYATAIVAASDFLSINYYCHRGFDDWSAKSPQETQADLDAMRTLADGRPILIQELGCSTGFDGGALQVGDDAQAEWLQSTIDAFADDPTTFRGAYWFTLTDWSPEVSALLSEPLCDEGFQNLCEEMDEAVQTYGVLRWEDGSARPAFDVLVDAVSRSDDE